MVDAALKATLKKKYGTEQVYVIPFGSALMVPDKFSAPCRLPEMQVLGGQFILRSDAEYNNAVVQPIPYILVTNKEHSKVYVTKRIAGEERLKDSLALGCGGHINPCDAGDTLIRNAALREMNEELKIRLAKDTELQTVGSVRDLESPTREHLGIVMIATAASVSVKEKESLEGHWMDFHDLLREYHHFESWARLIIDEMFLSKKGINGIF